MVKGSSGAVSIIGSFAALTGSMIIVLSSYFSFKNLTLSAMLVLVFSGFLATFIDSIMGATIQVQYIDNINNKITERLYDSSGQQNKSIRGIEWINNDVVNFLSILSAPVFFMILKSLFLL